MFFCLQQCKNYKNHTSFFRVMITNVLPLFYESQCIFESIFGGVNTIDVKLSLTLETKAKPFRLRPKFWPGGQPVLKALTSRVNADRFWSYYFVICNWCSIFGRPLSVCPVYLYVTLLYCDKSVGWIKTPLGMEVGLGPGHIVLDGDPASPSKGAQPPPNFRPMSVVANSWMDQDAT